MKFLRSLWQDEAGLGIVEIAIIIIIVIALALLFKEQITNLLEKIFDNMNANIGKLG